MVDREVKFRIVLDDQATEGMQRIKAQMDSLGGSTLKMAGSVAGGGGASTPNVGGTKGGGKKKSVPPENQMVPEEWGRPLRAMGAYRTAWFAGQDMSGTPMKAAAGIFILQAIGDGIKKIVEILSNASPALRAELKILNVAFNEIMRPMGDVVATVLKPIARRLLQTSALARTELAKEGYTPGTTDYAGQYNDVMLHEFWHMLSGQEGMGSKEVSDSIDDLRTAADIFGKTIDKEEFESAKRSATYKIIASESSSVEMSPAEKDLLGMSYEDYKSKYGLEEEHDLNEPEWWESEFWTEFGSGKWWPTTLSSNLSTFDSVMGNINTSLSTFSGALSNVADILNTVGDAGKGASDILGDVGDAGKGASDFVGGIWKSAAGYFG